MRVERRNTELLVHLTFSDAAYIRDGDGSALEELAEQIREAMPEEVDQNQDEDSDFDHQSGRGI